MDVLITVSTHSRLKAAGKQQSRFYTRLHRFNTQPPEGGWQLGIGGHESGSSFNTQPPEGGWLISLLFDLFQLRFQHTAA